MLMKKHVDIDLSNTAYLARRTVSEPGTQWVNFTDEAQLYPIIRQSNKMNTYGCNV